MHMVVVVRCCVRGKGQVLSCALTCAPSCAPISLQEGSLTHTIMLIIGAKYF